jgi:sialate O-acetylesterase
MKKIASFLSALVLAASPSALAGEEAEAPLSVAPMFGHNAVLQRDVPLPVWGTAAPGAQVSVRVQRPDGAGEGKAVADAEGRWRTTLAAQRVTAPSEEPAKIVIEAVSGTREDRLSVTNVLFGDVWLCSGQSNMDMNYGWGLTRGKEDIETNVYDRIRLFDDQNAVSFTPLDTLSKPAAWVPCDFAHAKTFSAAGYFFAQALQRGVGFPDCGADARDRLDGVPIGLVEATWSGSPICTWLSAEAYCGADPEFAAKYAALAKEMADPAPGAKRPKVSMWTPAASYNAMLHPLFPMAMKGAIWYQGCSDVNRPDLYEKLFRALAADWRAHFTHPDGFPIFMVQLASIVAMHDEPVESNWAWMRWTQMRLGETVDKCGTAVIIDIDEHKLMHPKDKKTVGERLARLALARVYRVGELAEAGPIPLKAELRDGRVVISFKNAEGLKTSDGGRLRGFQLKDEKGNSAFRQGEIVGETVAIPVPDDCRPVRVRHAWDDFPDCNLVNGEGLPCGPFEFGLE